MLLPGLEGRRGLTFDQTLFVQFLGHVPVVEPAVVYEAATHSKTHEQIQNPRFLEEYYVALGVE